MRFCKIAFNTLFAGVFVLLSSSVFAQVEDVIVLDNTSNDFLLPSYFESQEIANAQPMPPAMTEPVYATAPTQVPTDVDILNEIFGSQTVAPAPTKQAATKPQSKSQTFYPSKNIGVRQEQEQPLLTPLPPIPAVPEPTIEPPKHTAHKSLYASKLLGKETGKGKSNVQFPKEIRLMFNPGSTQLSESIVKWISAYALHVRKDPRLVLNIRISTQNWDIQQSRLGLIVKLLIEKGLSTRQIQVFRANRDPNTLILSAETSPTQTQIIVPDETKRVIREQKTFVW